MPPLAPLTLSTGFAAGPLRGRGGVLTPLFALGVGCLLLAEREAAFSRLPASTLNEALPHLHTPTSHKLPGTLAVPRTLGGAFPLFALAFLFGPRGAQPIPFRYREEQAPCVVPVGIPRGGGAR
jgi:hypothetical protein